MNRTAGISIMFHQFREYMKCCYRDRFKKLLIRDSETTCTLQNTANKAWNQLFLFRSTQNKLSCLKGSSRKSWVLFSELKLNLDFLPRTKPGNCNSHKQVPLNQWHCLCHAWGRIWPGSCDFYTPAAWAVFPPLNEDTLLYQRLSAFLDCAYS